MKKLKEMLFLTVLILFTSCSPKISTSLIKSYPPLDYKREVAVIELNEQIPDNAEIIGHVKIGDTGFSSNCNYNVVLDKAKLEARKAGGNAIKITSHKLPSMMGSSCHQINAQLLRIENTDSLVVKKEVDSLLNVDYAVLNVYRYSGIGPLINYDLHLGDSVLCRVKNNFKTTLHITKEGLNSLWAKTEAKSEVPVDIKMGKVYYLRCSVSMGLFVGRPNIELVDQYEGKSEFESFNAKHK